MSTAVKKHNCLVGTCVFTLLILFGNFHLGIEMLKGLHTLVLNISELTVDITLKFYGNIHIWIYVHIKAGHLTHQPPELPDPGTLTVLPLVTQNSELEVVHSKDKSSSCSLWRITTHSLILLECFLNTCLVKLWHTMVLWSCTPQL